MAEVPRKTDTKSSTEPFAKLETQLEKRVEELERKTKEQGEELERKAKELYIFQCIFYGFLIVVALVLIFTVWL